VDYHGVDAGVHDYPATGGILVEITSRMSDRFWKKVKKGDGCWLWTASTNPQGYGKFGVKIGGKNKTAAAHRVSWLLTNGPIPDGKLLMHKCDNPLCVNPSHLELGTTFDNIRDMMAKGRRGYTGLQGSKNPKSKLSESQVSDIRAAFESGESRADIARRYGMNWGSVDNIVKGVYWKHTITEWDRSYTTILLPDEY
jgi:HNH endonuclease